MTIKTDDVIGKCLNCLDSVDMVGFHSKYKDDFFYMCKKCNKKISISIEDIIEEPYTNDICSSGMINDWSL